MVIYWNFGNLLDLKLFTGIFCILLETWLLFTGKKYFFTGRLNCRLFF